MSFSQLAMELQLQIFKYAFWNARWVHTPASYSGGFDEALDCQYLLCTSGRGSRQRVFVPERWDIEGLLYACRISRIATLECWIEYLKPRVSFSFYAEDIEILEDVLDEMKHGKRSRETSAAL